MLSGQASYDIIWLKYYQKIGEKIMQQPEKQEALLAYVKEHFEKTGYEVKEAVKDTVKIFTPDRSITLKCRNNGEIIEVSSRMRRGRKNASANVSDNVTGNPLENDKDDSKASQKHQGMHEIMDVPVSREHSDKSVYSDDISEPAKPKRHRRTKAEIEADIAKETAVKTNTEDKTEPIESPFMIPEKVPEPEEEIIHISETPNPYSPGDSVELLYGSHQAFTVEECIGNTCRVVASTGEWTEFTIAVSDLKHSEKQARKIEFTK